MTAATVTRLLDGLEKDGYIKRESDPKDRRANPVSLTESGRELLDKLVPGHFAAVNKFYGIYSEAEQRELARLLEKLYDQLKEEE